MSAQDKDSDKRQLAAISRYAKAPDTRSSPLLRRRRQGADPVAGRPEFARMLTALLANGARTIIVESPDRFTRDLAQQLLGHNMLEDMGLTLIAASAPQHFIEDTPTAVMVRQILGSVSEFEKTTLVAKLKAARDRKKAITGKCGGRKSHLETRPDVVALAKSLRRRKPKGGQMSLREIAQALAAQGHVNAAGKPFNPKSVQSMLTGRGARHEVSVSRRLWLRSTSYHLVTRGEGSGDEETNFRLAVEASAAGNEGPARGRAFSLSPTVVRLEAAAERHGHAAVHLSANVIVVRLEAAAERHGRAAERLAIDCPAVRLEAAAKRYGGD